MEEIKIKKYYVYIYFVIETNEIFYVGKGSGNRAWTGKRNKFCEDMKATHNWDVKILKNNLYEEDAFVYEQQYILEFKDNNRLTNQTKGGDGISGYVMPKEVKLKISKSSKEKWETDFEFRENQLYHRKHGIYVSDEFRKKMSLVTKGELNGNYGNNWTDEMKENLSKKLKEEETHKGINNSRATKIRCVETGEVFDYIRLACIKYNMKSQASITVALNNSNRTAYGYHWERI